MTNTDILKMGLKREFWEYRRTLYAVPIILSIVIFLAAFMATMYAEHFHELVMDEVKVERSEGAESEDGADVEVEVGVNVSGDNDIHIEMQDSPVEFVSIYIGLAWFVGLYYLLSCLYSDRRDNSVLYWKSLPVSETQNVLSKLAFGTLAFAAFSIVAAWLLYLLLTLLGWGSMETNEAGQLVRVESEFQPIKLFFWPLHGVIAGVLWGLPVFGYFMFISAYAKRARFLWLIIPLAVISALEGIFLSSRSVVEFFTSHMPHRILETLGRSDTLSAFWAELFGPMLPSLLFGLIVGTGLVVAAIWMRNHRFEV